MSADLVVSWSFLTVEVGLDQRKVSGRGLIGGGLSSGEARKTKEGGSEEEHPDSKVKE